MGRASEVLEDSEKANNKHWGTVWSLWGVRLKPRASFHTVPASIHCVGPCREFISQPRTHMGLLFRKH